MIEGGVETDRAGTSQHQRRCQSLRSPAADGQRAAIEIQELSESATAGDIDLERATSIHRSEVCPAVGDSRGGGPKSGVVLDFQNAGSDGHPALEGIGAGDDGGAGTKLLKVAHAGYDSGNGHRVAAVDAKGAVVQDGSAAHHARRAATSGAAAKLEVTVANVGGTRAGHVIREQSTSATGGGEDGVGGAVHVGEHQIPQGIVLIDDQFISSARGEAGGDGGGVRSHAAADKNAPRFKAHRPGDVSIIRAAEANGRRGGTCHRACGCDVGVKIRAKSVCGIAGESGNRSARPVGNGPGAAAKCGPAAEDATGTIDRAGRSSARAHGQGATHRTRDIPQIDACESGKLRVCRFRIKMDP